MVAPHHHTPTTTHRSSTPKTMSTTKMTTRQQQQHQATSQSPSRTNSNSGNSSHNLGVPGLIHLPQTRQQSPKKSRTKRGPNKSTLNDDSTHDSSFKDDFWAQPPLFDRVTQDAQTLSHDDQAPQKPQTQLQKPSTRSNKSTAPNVVAGASPSKAKRTRGRNSSRQSSPPLEAQTSAHHHHHHSTESSAFDALAPSSSSDEWDMPSSNFGATSLSSLPKEALTWQQQESLSRSNSNAANSSFSGNSRRAQAKSKQSASRKSQARGITSHEIGSASTSSSSPAITSPNNVSVSSSALTWQQELLQQSDSAITSNYSNNPRNNNTPQKGISPAKLRRHQQKDEETFGIGALDLADTTSTPRRQGNAGSRSSNKPRSSNVVAPFVNNSISTPSKNPLTEERYAGPTFHNSPLASSLPTPSFMLRKAKALDLGGV